MCARIIGIITTPFQSDFFEVFTRCQWVPFYWTHHPDHLTQVLSVHTVITVWTVMMDHLRCAATTQDIVAREYISERAVIRSNNFFPWTTLKQSYHGADITPRVFYDIVSHMCIFGLIHTGTDESNNLFVFLSGQKPKIVWKGTRSSKAKRAREGMTKSFRVSWLHHFFLNAPQQNVVSSMSE